MGKFKLPLDVGFPALIAHIKQIKATADKAGSAVADLATETAAGLEEVEGILNGKQEKGQAKAVTILASGWTSVQGSAYPFQYDIAVEGLTALDRADVSIALESVQFANDCGLCPTSETITGAIRLRSAVKPTANIAAEYWIYVGKE